MNPLSKKVFCLFFCASLTWGGALSSCLAAQTNSAEPRTPLLQPITLFRDDHTDKKIKSISTPQVPRQRPQSVFKPGQKLTLEETLSIVDTHYPTLLKGHIEREQATAKILEAQGAFDPVLAHISEYKRIQDIVVPGKAKNAIHNEALLELPTRSGIRLFGQVRLNPNDASTPFLQSGRAGEYSAGFILPLMRGLGINKERAQEQKARFGEPLASVNLNLSRMNVLFDASASYWLWYASVKKLQVARGLLDIAEKRAAYVSNRFQQGDLARLSVTEAEKEVRRRRGGLYKAEREVAKNAFKLALFLWSGNNEMPPQLDEMQIDEPESKEELLTKTDIDTGLKRALDVRPEINAVRVKKEMAQVDLRLARNSILPKIDMLYRQGADTGPFGIGVVMAGGVKMSVPLRQRTARGQIRQAELEIQKLELEENFWRRKIHLEIHDTASGVNAALQRLQQAREEVATAQKVEDGERQRFEMGDSSLFLVNRRERERAEAQEKQIDLLGEYLTAKAAFQTVTGTI